MLASVIATALSVALALSNIYSTFKILRHAGSDKVLRQELQFWGVYILAFALTGFFREEKPHFQVAAALLLVLIKNLDTENTILSSVFQLAERGVGFVDTHLIVPNTQTLLVRPCVHLVEYGLLTVRRSRSISATDQLVAADSVQRVSGLIRAEIVSRDKQRFTTALDSGTTEKLSVPKQTSNNTTPSKEAKKLTFAALRKYFAQNGVAMSDEQVAKILKTYQGRDAELRRKLEAKYKNTLEEQHAAGLATPTSADGHLQSRGSDNMERSGPSIDNLRYRRRMTTPMGH